MDRIQRFLELLGLRRAQTRTVARLERELAASERRVVDLRTDQLLAGRRRVRFGRRRHELDRQFAEAVKDGETPAAVAISTEAAHVVERVRASEIEEGELTGKLVNALRALESVKQERIRAQLDRAATSRRLSDVLWGAGDDALTQI